MNQPVSGVFKEHTAMNTSPQQIPALVLSIMLGLAAPVINGCHSDGKSMDGPDSLYYSKPSVSENGTIITFPLGSIGLQQIKTTTLHKGTVLIPVIAPARVVASIASTPGSATDRLILFESPDVTSLYSQYRQNRTNLDRTKKNYTRAKEMYDNHGATSKELNEAETDVATAQAAFEEAQAKLRATGYAPQELDAAASGNAWLMCDVPESELNEVQPGEEVDIMFSAFPGKKFTGHEVAIGDVVDPVTRSVKVRVTVPNPNRRFLPGMFAQVDFGDPKNGIILLPSSAVVRVEEKDYVFVVSRPGQFQRREVILENTNSDTLIVKSRLHDSDEVVVEGTMLLKGLSFGF